MKTAVINVKTEPRIKKKAQKIANDLGLSLGGVINALLHDFVRKQRLEVGYEEELTDYAVQALKESEEDIKNGFASPGFDNAKDAVAWLKNPRRKCANQI